MPKDLLIIDDRKIRAASFQKAEKTLKKLDTLEIKIQSFRDQDQRLFEEWYNLTFRTEIAVQQESQRRYAELGESHRRMLAAADALKISMPEAYLKIKKEEAEHEHGTPETRSKIEALWTKRETYLFEERAKERAQQSFTFGDGDNEDNESEDEDGFHSRRKRFVDLQNLNDEQLKAFLTEDDDGFDFLTDVARACSDNGRVDFFIRVYDLAPESLQGEFEELMSELNGRPFEKDMSDMRKKYDRHQTAESDDPETEIKRLYRSLARRLHPDAINLRQMPAWAGALWERVQKSYHEKDLRGLRNLDRMTVLRTKELNSLTLSEINESEEWLKWELDRLNHETSYMRNSPAWNFSRKKNYASLGKRIRKEFDNNLDYIIGEIEELRNYHAQLEQLGKRIKGRRRP